MRHVLARQAGHEARLIDLQVDSHDFYFKTIRDWQPDVEEEPILNSAADLERWSQAGPGGLDWMTEEGGFARTFGGLGMPWYPVKEYGDFSLKLQWRDSSTGTNGNSGIFARFPHPEEAVARPPAERYPCQVGSATSQPAWVAIFCGHEIQINDHQGDTQKTGSIYNFQAPDAARRDEVLNPPGQWNTYEITVDDPEIIVRLNGVVINEYVHDPGTYPNRDISATKLGIQNHGPGDTIFYRRIQVSDAGAVNNPPVIESIAADPRIASAIRTPGVVLNARCVSSR